MANKSPEQSRSLSGTDAAFLYLERKEIPLHIACVSVFDGPIPFDQFLAKIDSKLHLIPRYRQIAVPPPYQLGYPSWEWDPHFDIRNHVFRVRADPPGGDAELSELAGHIFSQLMDRGKPLWDIHVVDGLKDGRGALIPRVHHALADGISGAAILNAIFDLTPEASLAITKRQYRVPRMRPKPEKSLADALTNAVRNTLENLVAAEAGLAGMAQGLLAGPMHESLPGLLNLLPELAASVERLPFNQPCTGQRRFCWAEFSFADVQAIRAVVGASVNDVILTVLARSVARYARLHGERIEHRFVRVVCPYSLRRNDQGQSLGNQISFLPVALPLDIHDPLETLRAVAVRTKIMKGARAADLLALVTAWLGSAPPPLQSLFWRSIPLIPLPLPLLNMICTNVPGSPVPLYSVGRRMIATYPQVPTGYELGIGCAAQSYDGKIGFGITSDTDAAPDAHRLRDFLRVSFAELSRAAGIKKTPRPRAPKAAPVAPAA